MQGVPVKMQKIGSENEISCLYLLIFPSLFKSFCLFFLYNQGLVLHNRMISL